MPPNRHFIGRRTPSTERLAAMGQFNETRDKAGILQAGEGLQPCARGKRVRFPGKERTAIDRPFAETAEPVAGAWLWPVRSMAAAVAWVKCSPLFGMKDAGDAITPELRKQEARRPAPPPLTRTACPAPASPACR